jgi:hypothetical protein
MRQKERIVMIRSFASWDGRANDPKLEGLKMKRAKLFVLAGMLMALAAATRLTAADDARAPEGAPQLPPGWTAEEMQKVIAAGTPGKEHAKLVEGAGTWKAECEMWMAPDAEPMKSTGTSTVKPIMGGRYILVEMKGEMPGMGPYEGMGIYGYDNVAKEYTSTWLDNFSTGTMRGTGKLSPDGKQLTWNYKVHCPRTDKMIAMREVETFEGPNSKSMETWGEDPKTGKEFKMMSLKLTREGNQQAQR